MSLVFLLFFHLLLSSFLGKHSPLLMMFSPPFSLNAVMLTSPHLNTFGYTCFYYTRSSLYPSRKTDLSECTTARDTKPGFCSVVRARACVFIVQVYVYIY